MRALAVVLVAVLIGLAMLHAYWGTGGRWPGHDDASLVERVVGRTRGMRAPSPVACFAVAAALSGAAALVALHVGEALGGGPGLLVEVGFWGAALVFLLRGLAGYVPAIFRHTVGTPFQRLNRILYSPLCLGIAAAFGALG